MYYNSIFSLFFNISPRYRFLKNRKNPEKSAEPGLDRSK